MKPNPLILIVAVVCSLSALSNSASAQGTAFTYQGRLNTGGSPANGTYDIAFSLYTANAGGVAVAGPVTNSAVGVTNGLFTTTVDFGNVLTGASNWLAIAVSTNGANAFSTLSPRQQLTPAPYAIYAENANSLAGPVSASQLTSIGNPSSTSHNFFVGPSGNATTSGYDNTANGFGALTSTTSGHDNTANGFDALASNADGYGNTAQGGQALQYNTSGIYNTANGLVALINNLSGGYNTANGYAALQSNTNGSFNTANGALALFRNQSGSYNIALGYQAGDLIFAGSSNIDIGNEGLSTDNNIIRIGSGQTATYLAGTIYASNPSAPLHVASSGIPAAIVDGSASAGTWLDLRNTSAGGTNWLLISTASGNGEGAGKLLFSAGSGPGLSGPEPLVLSASGATVNGTFNNNSDRDAKQDFASVAPAQILDRVTRLPLSQWSYKADAATRHIGPMAQDFHATFNVGTDDRHIAPIDEGGVALAAIQGLNQKLERDLEQKRTEITELKQTVNELKQLIEAVNHKLDGGEK